MVSEKVWRHLLPGKIRWQKVTRVQSTGYPRCQLQCKNETWRGAKEYEYENDQEGGKKRDVETEKETGKFLSITNEDLWAQQKVLSSRKGSLSATYKKNTEANTKVFDFNLKTLHALDRLAGVCATFEDTWANVENQISEGDIPMDELAKAQEHQARLQDELKSSRESHDMALVDLEESMSKVDDTREVLDTPCRGLEDMSKKTIELKRKADDAHDRTRSHRERCRRATKYCVMAEEVLNDSLGCLGDLVKDTAGAPHALTCGVPVQNRMKSATSKGEAPEASRQASRWRSPW